MHYIHDTYHFIQQSRGICLCRIDVQEVRLVLAPEGAPHSEVSVRPEPDHHLVRVPVIQDALEHLVLLTESHRPGGRLK